MDEDFKTTPMRPIREVLHEVEAELYKPNRPDKYEPPCSLCNGTGTQVIYNEQTRVTSARPCVH